MDKVQVIILAAGLGKRMESDDPKALAPLKGRPFLEHILENVAKLNLAIQPIIVVGHKKERIKEVLGNSHIYGEQKEQLGTGHAVQSAKDLAHKDHEIVVVLSADQPMVSVGTLEKIITKQKEHSPAVTIGTAVVPDFNEWRANLNSFGRVIRNTEGAVQEVIELKDASEEEKNIKEVNLGLYAFDKEWLWQNIDKLKNENAQGEYYLTDMIGLAVSQNKKVESVEVTNLIEGLQPNSKAELETLEKLL